MDASSMEIGRSVLEQLLEFQNLFCTHSGVAQEPGDAVTLCS